jgi:hypothetical protein
VRDERLREARRPRLENALDHRWAVGLLLRRPIRRTTPVRSRAPSWPERLLPGQKLLVLLRRGAVATVAVRESELRYAALLYNPAVWNDRNAYKVEEGEVAVTFKACKKGERGPVGGPLNAMSQFNGGFVVAGVRCVPLDVRVQGREGAIPVRLPFGAGRCS